MPSPKPLPVSELLRLACEYAEQDRQTFIDAHAHMPNDPAAVEAREYLEQLRAYRAKRWGKTLFQVFLESAEDVSLDELRKRT